MFATSMNILCMEANFEIILKFEGRNIYPELSWKDTCIPEKSEVFRKIYHFANKFEIPLDYIENCAVVFIDRIESSNIDDPIILEIDFSLLGNSNLQKSSELNFDNKSLPISL